MFDPSSLGTNSKCTDGLRDVRGDAVGAMGASGVIYEGCGGEVDAIHLL